MHFTLHQCIAFKKCKFSYLYSSILRQKFPHFCSVLRNIFLNDHNPVKHFPQKCIGQNLSFVIYLLNGQLMEIWTMRQSTRILTNGKRLDPTAMDIKVNHCMCNLVILNLFAQTNTILASENKTLLSRINCVCINAACAYH